MTRRNNKYTNPWTKEEIKIIKENYNKISNIELGLLILNHPICSIKGKLKELGLKKDKELKIKILKKNIEKTREIIRIPQKERDFIKENCLIFSDKEIAKSLGKTEVAIRSTRKRYKILKDWDSKNAIRKRLFRGVGTRKGCKDKISGLEKGTRVIINCFECDLPFESYSAQERKFCSEKCMGIYQSKTRISFKDTSIEIKIQNFLTQLHIEYLAHKYISEITHSYQCDIFIPEQETEGIIISKKTIIECDGCYFHACPICKIKSINKKRFDKERTEELIEKGFRVIRLWEHEIKPMEIDDFKERLNAD